jgi:hypothetical protein
MPINPKHAEEYELPELSESSGHALRDDQEVELERLLDNEDKPQDTAEQEHIGKGTKIDDLIARVCIPL